MTSRRLHHSCLLGTLTLTADGDMFTGVYFPSHRVLPARALVGDEVAHDELLDEVARQLDEYLAGTRTDFDVPFDLRPRSAVEERVWQLLQEIPYGETTNYGALATAMGDPHLAQAVGGACGRNPVAIIVPCHRVLGADGAYTGFAGGEHRKAWLLGHEAYVSGRTLFPPELFVEPPQTQAGVAR